MCLWYRHQKVSSSGLFLFAGALFKCVCLPMCELVHSGISKQCRNAQIQHQMIKIEKLLITLEC